VGKEKQKNPYWVGTARRGKRGNKILTGSLGVKVRKKSTKEKFKQKRWGRCTKGGEMGKRKENKKNRGQGLAKENVGTQSEGPRGDPEGTKGEI